VQILEAHCGCDGCDASGGFAEEGQMAFKEVAMKSTGSILTRLHMSERRPMAVSFSLARLPIINL
jgi:hypothetical protein